MLQEKRRELICWVVIVVGRLSVGFLMIFVCRGRLRVGEMI